MEKADVIGIGLILLIVVGIPMGVSALNEWKIGAADDPVLTADNLLTGTYEYENSTGSTMTETLSYSYMSGDNEEYFICTVPTVSASDSASDTITLEFDSPNAQELIDQGIIELYSQIETSDNYENLGFTVKYVGDSGSVNLEDNTNIDGSNFGNLEEISTDFAYAIKAEAGENATPKIVLTNPAGDNSVFAGESLEARSWGFDAATSVALTHEGVWQISLTLMGIGGLFGAVLATKKLDLEWN